MASGRPILAYGPGEVASCKYIVEQGCGIVVGVEDAELLARAVSLLATDLQMRTRLGECGRKAALTRHHAAIEHESFRNILIESCAT